MHSHHLLLSYRQNWLTFSRQMRVWRHKDLKGRVWGWGVLSEWVSIMRAVGALSCFCICSLSAGPSAWQYSPRGKAGWHLRGQLISTEKSMHQWVLPVAAFAAIVGLLRSQITAFIRQISFLKYLFVSWSLSLPLHEIPNWASRSPDMVFSAPGGLSQAQGETWVALGTWRDSLGPTVGLRVPYFLRFPITWLLGLWI